MKASHPLTITARGVQAPRLAIEKPAVSSGFCEADEGTRTLDLLHGKDSASRTGNAETGQIGSGHATHNLGATPLGSGRSGE